MRLAKIRAILTKFTHVKIFNSGTSRVIVIPKFFKELIKAVAFEVAYLTKEEALEYLERLHDDDRGILIAIPIFKYDKDLFDKKRGE